MPKTLDALVQETLGVQTLTILRLQAENEALRAEVAALKPKLEGEPTDGPR